MLEFLLALVLNQEAQHLQGNQGTQQDQDDQVIQENQGNQHFKTGSQCLIQGVLCAIQNTSPNETLSRCKSVSKTYNLITAGGRIRCNQCQATSKRTKQQCRAPAIKEKSKCRFHGGKSTGPKSQDGLKRCAKARTIHGSETRKARTERALAARRLRDLEDIGRSIGLIRGTKTAGRKPK